MPRKLLGRLAFVACAALLLTGTTGCPGRLRQPGVPVLVAVSGPLTLEDIVVHGSLVKARRASEPVVWLACGDLFLDRRAACLTDGQASIRLLEAAGADGVVLGPDWLGLGPERLAELVGGSRLQFLGANLLDSTGQELGHPLYVRQLDGAALGLTAVWLDSTDVRLRELGVEPAGADFAARKTLPLLRRRAEVVGIAVRPPGPVPDWDADFLIGATGDGLPGVAVPTGGGQLSRLELVIRGGRVTEFHANGPERVDAKADAGLKAVLDSVRAEVDSLAARTVTTAQAAIVPRILTNALVAGCVGPDVDGFFYDRPLATDTLRVGPVTQGAVIDLLDEPGRAALVALTGREIEALLDVESVEAGWRKGVKMVRMPLNKEYRVMMTTGFLARHPEAAPRGFELDEKPLWQRAVEALARAGRES